MTWPTRLPLIAILRGITPDEVIVHVAKLIEVGFDAIEVPLNSPNSLISIERLVSEFGTQACIGAGTVLDVEAVDRLAALKCRLIVTPNTDPAVVRRARGHDMLCAIGCATPSEAFAAIRAGAQAIKIFPAGIFGPAYIRALKAVLPPDLPVFAVGGVTPGTLADYLAAGCVGAGLGGDLYQPGQPVSRTEQQAHAFIEAYRSAVKVKQ
jgi:2-dehydro-3-deoxyphosphogalactonate aldolase